MKIWAVTGLSAAALALTLTTVACKGTGTTTEPGTDADLGSGDLGFPQTPGDGHVIDAVYAELLAKAAPLRGRTWNLSTENLLSGSWLLQSPPPSHWGKPYAELAIPAPCVGAGCVADYGLRACTQQSDCREGGTCTEVASTVTAPGGTPQKLCIGPSDYLYEEMYRVIASAERQVDVTSLLPPDGRFETAMRNAVTYLSKKGSQATVRFSFGNYPFPGGSVDARAVLTRLTRDVPIGSQLQVYVGSYRSSNLPPSWNHSKIVAADGKLAIVGGHNLWDAHYLQKNLVHDISMKLRGPAAVDAHFFAEEQWKYTCSTMNTVYCTTGSVCAYGYVAGLTINQCPPALVAAQLSPDKPGDTRVIGMGRLAYVDRNNLSNTSDLAFLTMIGAARTSVKISQQDIGPPAVPLLGIPAGSWPDALFAQLGAAVVRGVDVYLVVSNKDSVAGGLTATYAGYSNGWTADDVALKLRDYVERNPPPGAPTGAALRELLCKKVHIAPLRFSSEDAFPDGVPFPNHAKFVMVDDQAFYIGSQNQYDAGLTEFGYLVDDARAAAVVVADYYAPLWLQSSRKAVTGSEAATCVLR